ncbi:MAG: membrane dipeptidase [Tepidisphaeraceae bacterium]|jgi:membrane dipeptidase
MLIVDAHLDLAYNAVGGRAVESSARLQTADDEGIPTVGLPDLCAGGVNLICATIFCEPASDGKVGYQTPDEAHAEAQRQLDWYHRQEQQFGTMRFVRGAADLAAPETQNAILLLEGADPIRDDTDLDNFWDAGLRIVGLAWKRTRYAGGTGAPGPITPDGVKLVKKLDQRGIIHDASHLANESFWRLMDLSVGPVMASHSNCRAIVPTDRQLSDEMIRAIAARGGVIGINFYQKFLLPPEQFGKRRATLADVTLHIRHICDLLGSANYVGLGTDMDGGLGRNEIPVEIETSADLPRVADALHDGGFSDADIHRIMAENWVDFFKGRLP